MAHFYFDLHECGKLTVDDEGYDVKDLETAREHAVQGARSIMAEELMRGKLCLGCSIIIRDRTGATVMAVRFNDAVSVTIASSH